MARRIHLVAYLAAALAAPPAIAGDWAGGANLGTGFLSVYTTDGNWQRIDEHANADEIALSYYLARNITDSIRLGGEVNSFFATQKSQIVSTTILLNTLFASAWYLVPDSGLRVRIGLGATQNETEIKTASAKSSAETTGKAWIIGVAYRCRAGETFGTQIGVDYSEQIYDEGGTRYTALSFGFSWK